MIAHFLSQAVDIGASTAARGGHSPGRPRLIIDRPLDLHSLQFDRALLNYCHSIDRLIRENAEWLIPSAIATDIIISRLAMCGRIDLDVSSDLPAVRMRTPESLDRDIADRRDTVIDAAPLAAMIAGRGLLPGHLKAAVESIWGGRQADFRTGQHYISPDADNIVMYYPPTDVPLSMTKLCAWINGEPPLPASLQALIAYLQVLKIHAFKDGNGRISRALLVAVLSARLLDLRLSHLPIMPVIFANAPVLASEFRRAVIVAGVPHFLRYAARMLEKTVRCARLVDSGFNFREGL